MSARFYIKVGHFFLFGKGGEMTEAKRVNVRGRPSANVPNPVDVYAGQRMRLRRTMLNMSQQTLARKLGITFQ